MVSGALGSAVFSAVTGVLLTRRYPLVVEGVRCSARSQRIITDDRLASGGRMVHHSIAVVITSCLTNFLERRLGEVRTGEVVLGVHRGGRSHSVPPRYRPYLEKPPPRLA